VAKAAAAEPDNADDESGASEPTRSGGRRKMILIAAAIALLGVGAGLWFSGVLPALLGTQHSAHSPEQAGTSTPSYVDVPEMITSLNTMRQPQYVKLTVRFQVMNQKDLERLKVVMPRLQDLVLTHIREMRSEELHRSADIYRLREEIITRANVAASPARITDVQFILTQ
jgi:flagellar FliL protein